MLSKISLVLAFTLIILASSCSSLLESTRKSVTGEPSARKVEKKPEWVSRTQYNDLMDRYKSLSKKYEDLKDENIKSRKGFDQVRELVNSESPETIDVFGSGGIALEAKSTTRINHNTSKEQIDRDVEYYKKAVSLKDNQKLDEAIKIFQFLEKSQTRQVRVRASSMIGSIYFSKNQYDLSLQVFEGIIRKQSFSGTVINALDYAAKCSEKLGLKEKQLKYESILKDFFEIRS